MDSDTRIREAMTTLAESIPVRTPRDVATPRQPSHAPRLVAIAAGLSVTVLIGGLLLARFGRNSEVNTVVAAGPVGWHKADAGPPFPVVDGVWTGNRLTVVGVALGGAGSESVAASWQRGEGWSPVTTLSMTGTDGSVVVAAGERVVAYGEGEAATLDTRGDWRRVQRPTVPSPRRALAAVWTGREVLLWGERLRGHESNVGVALDPVRQEWRPLPPAPTGLNQGEAVWNGQDMIVVGSKLTTSNSTEGGLGTVAQAYRPATNTWRQLAAPDLSPQSTSVAWAGDNLVAWDYELKVAHYEASADRWATYGSLPLRPAECVPSSGVIDDHRLFLNYCGQVALLNLDNGAIQPISPPDDFVDGIGIEMAGGYALVSSPGANGGLWIYRAG